MGIQVTRSGTNWTVDVTALGLVNDTGEKDFLVVINKTEQPLAAYVKTTATVITYSGAALPANTVIDFYRWGLRDVDQLEYGEVTSQLGMNRRLTQIERVLDDLREVKQFIWSGVDGSSAVATHVGQADPHNQYRLKSAAIPELAAHVADADPHPVYTTAAELTAALTGYLPTSQKGAINGLAPLDGTSKVPAINSRGCSAVYVAATGTWTFTWPDNSTQTIDTPLELVFQSVNYNSATKLVTFTLVGGATTTFSLADLVDLPEVQTNTANPVSPPTIGQKLYVRIDTGEMWVANGGAWVGPYLSFTGAERTKLAGVAIGATANSPDVTLLSRSNHTGAQPISSVTNLQTTLDSKQPIDSDLIAIAGLPNSNGLIRKISDGNAVLQPISTTGAAVLGGDAAGARAAIDLGTLAIQNKGAAQIDGGKIAGYITASPFVSDTAKFVSITPIVDRFLGANQRLTLTQSGATLSNLDNAFNQILDNEAILPASQTITLTLDLTPQHGANGPLYGAGYMIAVLRYGAVLAKCRIFTNYSGVAQWIDLGTYTNTGDYLTWDASFTHYFPTLVEFTFTAPASPYLEIKSLQYIATRPGTTDRQDMIVSASGVPQIITAPSIEIASKGGAKTTIGQGTLKLNNGATVTQILTATKTAAGTNPETITVTGAAVGDIAWISESVPAKVTTPSTVSFNGGGLSGTIRAVVMRAQ